VSAIWMEFALFFLQPEGGGGAARPPGGGGGAGANGCLGNASSLGMLALMFVVFYFMLIRPQQKRAREQQQMLSQLKKGDRIVTTGGLLGRISGLSDRLVTLEVAEKVRVQVLRNQITGIDTSAGGEPASAQDKDKKD
jgi:preprotein translocase subunit YajC